MKEADLVFEPVTLVDKIKRRRPEDMEVGERVTHNTASRSYRMLLTKRVRDEMHAKPNKAFSVATTDKTFVIRRDA